MYLAIKTPDGRVFHFKGAEGAPDKVEERFK
jgi:hypothetical protein